uniref:Uncharacterized protein n=1 Tax=Solanum tuberosum TaxID=4113 RepID=M1D0J5_SOLTU
MSVAYRIPYICYITFLFLQNNKSSASKHTGSKSGTSNNAPKVNNGLKTKVQMLKNTRDYSFLLSDDAELPVPSKGSLPHKTSVANSALPPSTKQFSSNTGRKLLDDRVVRKPILGSSQMPHQLLSQKSVSVSKQTQLALDSRKQLGSSKGSGPGRPLGVQPKIIGGPNGKRVLIPGVKSTVPALHKPTSSKLQPSIPRQYLVQKKEILQSGKSKVMPQQAEPSYKHKPIMQKQAVPSSNSQVSPIFSFACYPFYLFLLLQRMKTYLPFILVWVLRGGWVVVPRSSSGDEDMLILIFDFNR